MIVIGVDVHKRTHTLVAIDSQTGRQLHQCTVQATDAGHLDALRFARGLNDEEVVWAIEDCRHVSKRLEQALLGAGERVLRVPPALTWTGRRSQREPGKSDPIDALAVARTVVREGIERFPVAFLDQPAMEIRLLHDHREQLIRERTRTQNRLHFYVFQLDPELETSLTPRSLDHPRVLTRIRRRLHQLPVNSQTTGTKSRTASAGNHQILAHFNHPRKAEGQDN
jgi:transposase